MIHHLAIEVRPDQMAAEGEFWRAAGFERVPAPEALGPGYDWYENGGTQIHLMETAEPTEPPARGHVAIVAREIGAAIERLEAGGFEVREGRRLWGERRIKTVTPSGQVVELMAAPPVSGTDDQTAGDAGRPADGSDI